MNFHPEFALTTSQKSLKEALFLRQFKEWILAAFCAGFHIET
jgi:hypothetical protein